MQTIRTIAARFGAVLLGALAVVVAMELVLACTAALRNAPADHAAAAGHTIVCLGDSFTFGPNIPRHATYPAQLERLLNRGQTPRWRVVNAGQPANNTAQAQVRLARLLEQERPAALVLLIGWANSWNYRGFVAVTNAVVRTGTRQARVLSVLQHARVFVLGQLLLRGVREARAGHTPAPDARSLLHAERLSELDRLLRQAEAAPQVARHAAAVGMFWLTEQQLGEALAWFTRAVACDPHDSWGYIGACKALMSTGRRCEAYGWASNGLARCPFSPELLSFQVDLAIDAGHAAAALQAWSNGLAMAPNFPVFHQQAAVLAERFPAHATLVHALTSGAKPDQKYETPFNAQMQSTDWLYTRGRGPVSGQDKLAWVAHDLEALLALCAKAGVPVILQTYPLCFDGIVMPLPADTLAYQSGLNRLLAHVARTHGVPLADHQQVFAPHPRRTALFLYGKNEHPNADGYALMASNLHAVITAALPQVVRR
jgi:lysophospholipase L1-like esterase